MQTNQKISILKALGVQVWRDRFSKAPEEYFHTLRLDGASPILILADLDVAQQAEEKTLLEAIAKALGSVVTASVETWLDFGGQLAQYSVIIAMGAKISAQIKLKHPEIILTHGPAVLLREPKLKAETWQAIRHLKLDS